MKKDYNRQKLFVLLAVVPGLIVALGSAIGLGQDSVERQDPWAAYKVIVERNIFSRQRGARPERPDRGGVRTPPAPNPESYYLLKGIVQENGVFIAFLEDTQRGRILRVRDGDSVARGKVKISNLDTIEYQFEDRTVTVAMGNDLEGGQGAITLTQMYELSQAYSTTPQEGTTESSGPSADEAEILKQLMERRQQQIGQ
jgi:hypothetical protein